jgi:hypothetical protein
MWRVWPPTKVPCAHVHTLYLCTRQQWLRAAGREGKGKSCLQAPRRSLMEDRQAPGYGNLAAAAACLFPSGKPSALLAILSVFICLSSCVLLYLLMCLSLTHQRPLTEASVSEDTLLPLSLRGHSRTCTKPGKAASRPHSTLQFAFSSPHTGLIISCLVPKGV